MVLYAKGAKDVKLLTPDGVNLKQAAEIDPPGCSGDLSFI